MAKAKTAPKIYLKKRYIALIAVLCAAAAAYLGAIVYYSSHFLPSTTLNGMDVSQKTAKETEAMITAQINGYQLKLATRGGTKERIKGTDISLKPEFGGSISRKIKGQNSFAWPLSFFTNRKLEEETMVNFDQGALKKMVGSLSCMQKENQKAPKDAYISEYQADGYHIVPEEQGNEIKKKKLLSELSYAIHNLQGELSLEDSGCYKKPKTTADDEGLNSLADTLNKYTGVKLTYQIGDKTETLDGRVTHTWMQTDGTQVTIDGAAVEEYVNGLASSYNTVFRGHSLKTSYGKTVTITDGDYGWKVDKEGEKEQILSDLAAGQDVTREITYAQRASSHGENDYGDTYVEINLTAQHLFFYKNGSLIVESDFVSGNASKHYDTPTGIYGLTYKERDATLRGEDYASKVAYWMPYCNNVGMHDASWRSSFGSNIYKTSGSHGCVNLPASAAKKIFENIEKGDPVLVYTLPGTESPAAVAQEAAQVVNLINAIGEVTLESEPAIAAARNQYNLLSEAGQAQVPNYDVLMAAEAQLAALKAQLMPEPQGE